VAVSWRDASLVHHIWGHPLLTKEEIIRATSAEKESRISALRPLACMGSIE
jgi:hypothetical protein